MRIVAGRHRGRVLDSPPSADVRPTSDRARESLFNILEHGKLAAGGLSPIREARVLDGFCGTGALGLEALSRGAAYVTFLDSDAASLRMAKANAAKLSESEHAAFVQADATRPPVGQPCSLIFLDAPYGKELTAPALAALAKSGWCAAGAIAVVETGLPEAVIPPAGFTVADERRYGKTKLTFLIWKGGA